MHKCKVIKTERLNQKKRSQLQIIYGLSLLDSYELQLGYLVELDATLAEQLIQAGLVIPAPVHLPTWVTMIDLDVDTPETGDLTEQL
jgi:hypothetical protein